MYIHILPHWCEKTSPDDVVSLDNESPHQNTERLLTWILNQGATMLGEDRK